MTTPDFSKHFDNKKVLIWGFGLEGRSTLKYILENCKGYKIMILDKNSNEARNYLESTGVSVPVITGFDQIEVFPLLCGQFQVRSFFYDPAIVQHDDFVRITDCA